MTEAWDDEVVFDPVAGRWRRRRPGTLEGVPGAPARRSNPAIPPPDDERAPRPGADEPPSVADRHAPAARRWPWVVGLVVAVVLAALLGLADEMQDGTAAGVVVTGEASHLVH